MKKIIEFEKHEYFSQGFFKNGEPIPGVQYQEDPYWNYKHSLISIDQEMEISKKLDLHSAGRGRNLAVISNINFLTEIARGDAKQAEHLKL